MALLFKMIYKRKVFAIIAICTSGLTAAVSLWWNFQLSGIINLVSVGVSPSQEMILWALVTMIVMGATNFVKGYIAGYTCEGITHDLRMGYARHFASLPVTDAEKLNTGEQLSKLQNEITGVSGYLNNNLFQIFDDAVRFFSTFIWLLFISPTLTLASNLPVFFIVLYVFWSSKIIGLATEQSQKAKGQMNQYTDTLLTLFPIIQLYSATRLTFNGYLNAIDIWKNQTILSERKKAWLMSLSAVLSSIPLLVLFLIGGQMTINGILTVGTLYIFLNLSGNLSGVMMNMPRYMTDFRQFSANIKRISPNIIFIGKEEQI